jgi:hypothetical protein
VLPGAAPAAAWSEWCDTDPVLLVRTPGGQLVPIFFLTGVYGERYAVSGLLANLSADYTAEPVAEGTAVEVRVTVPAGGRLFGSRIPTRLLVTQGPQGTLATYGGATGESGEPMIVRFTLDVP